MESETLIKLIYTILGVLVLSLLNKALQVLFESRTFKRGYNSCADRLAEELLTGSVSSIYLRELRILKQKGESRNPYMMGVDYYFRIREKG